MAEDPFVSSQQQQQQQQQPPQHTATQQQPPHIYRPIPRRNFSTQSHSSDSPELWPQSPPPTSNDLSSRGSDFLAQLNARLLRTNNAQNGSTQENGAEGGQPTRNKSFLNMTSSTLFGIYDDVGTSTTSVADTPWGTGAETPARHYSVDAGNGGVRGYENGIGSPDGGLKLKGLARNGAMDAQRHRPRSGYGLKPQRHGVWSIIVVVGKLLSLFAFGAVYGVIVSHLHDSRELAAVQVGGVDHESWTYLTGWGLAGLVLGSLLPYVDLMSTGHPKVRNAQEEEPEKEGEPSLSEQWNDVVRSVGAFLAIAFAIRRLPWQSTLQLTVTLALVNPALWYILDRSKNGLFFSLATTSVLTSAIFLSNPDVLPSPALPATLNATHTSPGAKPHTQNPEELFAGMVSYDNLVTTTWVGSVVFCSCICFGGIGRRLAVLDEWSRKR